MKVFVAECLVYGLFSVGLVIAGLVRALETVHWLVYRGAHAAARWGAMDLPGLQDPRSLRSWLGMDGE